MVVGAEFDGEGGGEGLTGSGVGWWEWFEVEEARFFSGVFLKIDLGDLIEERTVFEFGEAVLLGPGAAVGVIAGIGLCDENGAF